MSIKKYKALFFYTITFFGLFAKIISLNYGIKKTPSQWEETLPLGNGRLGIMLYGGVETEKKF